MSKPLLKNMYNLTGQQMFQVHQAVNDYYSLLTIKEALEAKLPGMIEAYLEFLSDETGEEYIFLTAAQREQAVDFIMDSEEFRENLLSDYRNAQENETDDIFYAQAILKKTVTHNVIRQILKELKIQEPHR